jgi:acetyl-CoA acetyltransferase
MAVLHAAPCDHIVRDAIPVISQCGVLPSGGKRGVHVSTIDNGGASPVTMLLQARALVESRQCSAVAVVAGDSISSLDPAEFLRRANASTAMPTGGWGRLRDDGQQVQVAKLGEPAIPHGYALCAEAHREAYGLTRQQLAMVSVLMSAQAAFHPDAVQRRPYALQEVLSAPEVAPHTSLFECARKSDGAAALIVTASPVHTDDNTYSASTQVVILGGCEASGPIGVPERNEGLGGGGQ